MRELSTKTKRNMNVISVKQAVVSSVVGVMGLALISLVPMMFENLDSGEYMVIQHPTSGELSVYTEPGLKYQGLGTVTKYPLRKQYSFCDSGCESAPKRLRFNDGGSALLTGSISWEMPGSAEQIIKIHRKFNSTKGVESQAVQAMFDNAVYLSGPLMSSTESSGERRAELVQAINDQAQLGVYETKVSTAQKLDELSDKPKTVSITEIVRDTKGQAVRQSQSILQEFGVRLLPMSISELSYSAEVESQIQARQQATTSVQLAVANARKAEQDTITIAKQGEAKAATAQWEQEAIKAKAVTLAEQQLQVAKLAEQEAQSYKRTQILIGEGDAARKRAVLEADGALEAKLAAYVQTQAIWARSFASYKGALVPQTVIGSAGQSRLASQDLLEMLTVKTAKELNLDLKTK